MTSSMTISFNDIIDKLTKTLDELLIEIGKFQKTYILRNN